MNKELSILDIIIVNWNAGDLLLNCVNSVLKSSLSKDSYNIFIIDNSSTDNSLQLVENISANVYVVHSAQNLGFGKACNLGVKQGKSPYLLFLNPDTEIFTDTIQKSIRFIEDNPDIGVLGVKQIDEKGYTRKSCSRFLKLGRSLFSIFGLSKIFPKSFKPETIMTNWDHESSKEVDQVMGAFMLVCRVDFEFIGGFDEQFFVYYEDMDLAKRILKAGKISYYNCEISVFHKGCGTTENIPVQRLVYVTISKLKYAKKHWTRFSYYFLLFLTVVVEPVTRSLLLVFKGNFSNTRAVLKAYFKIYVLLLKF